MQNRDVVIVNRQPTLHRESAMAHYVVIHSVSVLRDYLIGRHNSHQYWHCKSLNL